MLYILIRNRKVNSHFQINVEFLYPIKSANLNFTPVPVLMFTYSSSPSVNVNIFSDIFAGIKKCLFIHRADIGKVQNNQC